VLSGELDQTCDNAAQQPTCANCETDRQRATNDDRPSAATTSFAETKCCLGSELSFLRPLSLHAEKSAPIFALNCRDSRRRSLRA
jgi:hypothetical protein